MVTAVTKGYLDRRKARAEEAAHRADETKRDAEALQIMRAGEDGHYRDVIAHYKELLQQAQADVARLRERIDRLEEAIDQWQLLHAKAEMKIVEAEAEHMLATEQLRAQLRAMAADRKRPSDLPTGDLKPPTKPR